MNYKLIAINNRLWPKSWDMTLPIKYNITKYETLHQTHANNVDDLIIKKLKDLKSCINNHKLENIEIIFKSLQRPAPTDTGTIRSFMNNHLAILEMHYLEKLLFIFWDDLDNSTQDSITKFLKKRTQETLGYSGLCYTKALKKFVNGFIEVFPEKESELSKIT
jgi:hypothetical protein